MPLILTVCEQQLDLNLHIAPDFFMEFKIEPVRRVAVKIRVDNIKVQGTARLTFRFNDLFPDASVGSLSFMGDPVVEFSIKVGSYERRVNVRERERERERETEMKFVLLNILTFALSGEGGQRGRKGGWRE